MVDSVDPKDAGAAGIHRRISALKRPLSDFLNQMDAIGADEMKIGNGYTGFVLNDKTGVLELISANPGISAEVGTSTGELNLGSTVKQGTEMDHTIHKGKSINPMALHGSPNIVNQYQLVVRLPPTAMGGLMRGALVGMYAILQVLVDSEAYEDL